MRERAAKLQAESEMAALIAKGQRQLERTGTSVWPNNRINSTIVCGNKPTIQ